MEPEVDVDVDHVVQGEVPADDLQAELQPIVSTSTNGPALPNLPQDNSDSDDDTPLADSAKRVKLEKAYVLEK